MPTMRDRFATVTSQALDRDDRIAVVLAVIGADRFVATGAAHRHPDRVIDVGIREQLMVGVAAGLALEGIRPVVHTYAPFLVERAYEQIKLDLSHQDVGAVLVSVGASHDAAASGRTHYAPADVALMSTLPGWEIHVPGHPDEVAAVMRRALAGTGRVYVRLGMDVNEAAHAGASGAATVVRQGTPGAPVVVAVGPMLDRVLAATNDRDSTVLYVTSARPLDTATLRAVAATDVILVEPSLAGTTTDAVTEALRDRPRRILSLGVRNEELRRYGTRHEHDAAHGLDTAGIRASIDAFLGDLCCDRLTELIA